MSPRFYAHKKPCDFIIYFFCAQEAPMHSMFNACMESCLPVDSAGRLGKEVVSGIAEAQQGGKGLVNPSILLVFLIGQNLKRFLSIEEQ